LSARYHDIIREPAGADTAVLLLHGILSAPQFFDFLLPAIPPRYAVYGLLLEGHGGSMEGLCHTNLAHWKAQNRALMEQLAAKYKRIIIAAHSMGTLFAVGLATEFPEKTAKMLLLDVPLYPHLTLYGAVLSVMLACGFQPKTPRGQAMQKAYSIAPDARLWRYLRWIPRYLELFREMRRTRQHLGELRVPSQAYYSCKDELVSRKTLPLLHNAPHLRLGVLRKSSHFYYVPAERRRIERAWYRMLRTFRA
jgi:carboxylesterase